MRDGSEKKPDSRNRKVLKSCGKWDRHKRRRQRLGHN